MGDTGSSATSSSPACISLSRNSSDTSPARSRRLTQRDPSSRSSSSQASRIKNPIDRNPSSVVPSSSRISPDNKFLSNTTRSAFSEHSLEDQYAIHFAASNGNAIRIIELLRSYCIPINLKDEQGRTALHIAILYSRPIITSLLLSLGANPNFQDSDGNTAMHYAVLTGSYKVARELIVHKADLHITNNSGQSPYNIIPYKDDNRFNVFKVNANSAEQNV